MEHTLTELPISHALALQLADDAIDLFLEYRDCHGYDEERAKAAAALEVAEGASVHASLIPDPPEGSGR